MVAKLKLFSKRDIQLEHRKIHQAQAKRIAPMIANSLINKYELTLYNWKKTSNMRYGNTRIVQNPNYANVDIKVEYEIYTYKYGIEIIINSMIIDTTTGEYNPLWYWLDQGTKPYTFTQNSAIFAARSKNRTTPGQLEVASAAQFFGGHPIQIKAGQTREGIKARNWSRLIGFQVDKELRARIQNEDVNWKVKYHFDYPK